MKLQAISLILFIGVFQAISFDGYEFVVKPEIRTRISQRGD